ncbi:hypothetical protein NHQ30_006866 [Ciborinia camelliae]|nr:hypothetical protein NHQ30_006866 [Ciborinia camelliae]
MPIIRNPFARRSDVQTGLQPSQDDQNAPSRPSFERVNTVASRASSMSIKTARSEEPPEYKMSARSPISLIDGHGGRQSLDSARLPRMQRSAIGDRRFNRQPPTAEEGFEDVGLNDAANDSTKQIKKKGFFSKFGDEALPSFHIPGRKRGQSGTGEELGNISKPDNITPKVSEVDEVR